MGGDLKELKRKIYNDRNIQTILQELECEHIREEQNGKLIVAQLPCKFHSDNKRSIQVSNNGYLGAKIWSRGIKGDLFSIIGYILYDCVTFEEVSKQIYKIKKWILEILGYGELENQEYEKKQDWNSWLKKIRRKRVKHSNTEPNHPISEDVLLQYDMTPNSWWRKEGIHYSTQIEFEIGYDERTERIILPVRDELDRLVGIKGRYIGDNQRILDERKYIYLVPCNKSVMFYNLHRALPYIKERKEVIIFEAEKSCHYAFQYDFPNSVAICGSDLSPKQVEILKSLGLDIHLTFAWDADKSVKFIKNQIQATKGRNVSVVFDKNHLLSDKMAPVDRGIKIWEKLYKENKYPVFKI